MFNNEFMIEKIQQKIGFGETVKAVYTQMYGTRNTHVTITKDRVKVTKEDCNNETKGTLRKLYSQICKNK